MTRTALALLLFTLLPSCVTRHGDFTLMSTRNIDVSRIDELVRGPRVSGEDVQHIIVVVPTKVYPSTEDAFEEAIRQVPGAVAMTDVVIRQRAYWFLYGQVAWIIEGDTLIDPLIRNAHASNAQLRTSP